MAWTVMRIPGWRAMSPAGIDSAIRATLLTRRSESSVVVARRLPAAATPIGIAFTGPELVWEIFRDIGWYERLAWIGWGSLGWALAVVAARRRSRRSFPRHWSLPELPEFVTGARSESFASSE